jgi:hypothetical protein
MSNPVECFLDTLKPMLNIVDEILNAWNGEGCYQVPGLVLSVAAKLNWNDKQIRSNDPIIRAYLKDHPTWYVTRGAGGGVTRRDEWQKKEAIKVAKEKAKAELKLVLETKLIQPIVTTNVPSGDQVVATDNSNIV